MEVSSALMTGSFNGEMYVALLPGCTIGINLFLSIEEELLEWNLRSYMMSIRCDVGSNVAYEKKCIHCRFECSVVNKKSDLFICQRISM